MARADASDLREPPRAPSGDPVAEKRAVDGISVGVVVLVVTVFAITAIVEAMFVGQSPDWLPAVVIATATLWVTVMVALVVWITKRRRRMTAGPSA